MYKPKEVAKLVNIAKVTSNQQIIVNGIPQSMECYALICPVCGRVIYQAEDIPNAKELDITNLCNQAASELYNIATYCPSCGQKLRYERELVTDYCE